MRSPHKAVAATWHGLPRPTRTLLAADFVSNVGSGLVLPFLAVYVARIRDHGPHAGAAALAVLAVGSLVSNTVAGRAADRDDPRVVLVAGWLLTAAGDIAFLASARLPALLGAALLIGIGAGISFPTTATVLAAATPPGKRAAAFSARHGLFNVGAGIGIVAAGVIVATPDLTRFQVLYSLDALSYVAAAAMLIRARIRDVADQGCATNTGTGDNRSVSGRATGSRRGYAAVFADRRFAVLSAVQAAIMVFGYVQYHAALPIFLSRPGGLSATAIAAVFATNTIVVAAAAVFGGRLAAVFSRGRLISAGCLAFASCWLLLLGSSGPSDVAAAIAMLATAVMGVGEVLLAASVAPLLNDLAPPDLRGRYNAIDALILSVGTIVGPLLVAAIYPQFGGEALLGVLAIGCAAAALICRGLPADQLSIHASAP